MHKACQEHGEKILSGLGMFRIDKVWDVPVRPTPRGDLHAAAESVQAACVSLNLGLFACGVALSVLRRRLPLSTSFRREHGMFRATSLLCEAHTEDMTVESDVVLVPDDKKKKFMWKVPWLTYQCLLYHFALASPSWEVAQLSVKGANAWCLQVLCELLPSRIKKFLAFHKYKHAIPYYYGTVKSKRFAFQQRICKKVNRSCVRKVVSFASWPCRRRWRMIHKALETVLRSTGMGDEIWSLSAVT